MKTRNLTSRGGRPRLTTMLLALLIGVGTVGAAGIAHAQTSELFGASRTAAASTRGFWIDNLTTKRLKLTRVQSISDSENKELLPVGYVIQPGEIAHTELDATTGYYNHVIYEFDVLDIDGTVHSRINTGMLLDQWSVRWQALTTNTVVKAGAQPLVSSGWAIDVRYEPIAAALGATGLLEGQDLGIYDPQGTTFDGTTLTPPQQGRLIQNFCEQDAAHCNFIKDGEDGVPARSPAVVLGGRVPNSTCDDMPHSINRADRRSATHSWEFSASIKGGVKDVWEAQFTAKYGGSVVEGIDFSAIQGMQIRPGFIGYFSSTVPVYHHTGKWLIEVRVGGAGPVMTTIEVRGTVDVPDTSGGTAASVEGVTDPMTDQERAAIKQKCA